MTKAEPIIKHVQIGNAYLYCGDCIDALKRIGKVDAVITDPPYSAEAHAPGRRVLTRGQDNGRARSVDKAALPFEPLSAEVRTGVLNWASMNCSGWFLAFCQAEAVADWRADMEAAGGRWVRSQIWVKPDSSPQLTGDRPAQGYESIATGWFGAGRSKWNGGGRRGVYTFSKHDSGFGHGGSSNEHPTKKPIALMNELVSLFSEYGQTVIDPFMGSGTTGVACVNLGRKFIGIERDPDYFEIAVERICSAYAQCRLFA